MKSKPEKLRDLAAWYREFAELAENPMIWASRFRMAEDLEQEAEQLIVSGRSRIGPEDYAAGSFTLR